MGGPDAEGFLRDFAVVPAHNADPIPDSLTWHQATLMEPVAVWVHAFELQPLRIGETVGMMNIAMPSIVIKMMRQKFDQQWSLRKSESSEAEQQRIFELIRPAQMLADARLRGPTMSAETILALEPGHVVMLDYPVHRPLTLEFYGTPKYSGQVVDTKLKRGFVLEKFIDPKE
jgi:flagellar motor switch protein FliM